MGDVGLKETRSSDRENKTSVPAKFSFLAQFVVVGGRRHHVVADAIRVMSEQFPPGGQPVGLLKVTARVHHHNLEVEVTVVPDCLRSCKFGEHRFPLNHNLRRFEPSKCGAHAHRKETHQKKTLEVRLCRNVHNQSLQSSQNRRQNARRLSRHHPWKSCRERRLVHDSVQSCTRKLRDVVHAFNLLEETRAVCPHFQDCWCMEEPPALPQTLGPTHSGAQGGCPLASTQQQYASWSMPIRISVLVNSATTMS